MGKLTSLAFRTDDAVNFLHAIDKKLSNTVATMEKIGKLKCLKDSMSTS